MFGRFASGRQALRLVQHFRKQLLITINDSVPVIKLSDPVLGTVSIRMNKRAVTQYLAEFLGQVGFVGVGERGVANDLEIFGGAKRQDAISITHRFEQCRVRATNLSRMDIDVGVLL